MALGSIVLGLLAILFSLLVYQVLDTFDMLTSYPNINDSDCTLIDTPLGPEDFVLYGDFIISGVDDRTTLLTQPNATFTAPDGQLIAIDTRTNKYFNLPLFNFPSDSLAFHPHGIFNINETLYVINHAWQRGGERIEKFIISATENSLSIEWKESISLPDKYLGMLNDIAFYKDNDFFATTWSPEPDSPTGPNTDILSSLSKLGRWTFTKSTHVLRCKVMNEAVNCTEIDSGKMMNGVFLVKKRLFVTDTVDKKLNVYIMDRRGNFNKERAVDLPIHPDNILYSWVDKNLYIGGYNRQIDFITSGLNPGAIPKVSGGLLKVTPNEFKIEEVVKTDKYEGISVGMNIKDRYFLGSWAQKGVYVCPKQN